jgi:hypothetical protein
MFAISIASRRADQGGPPPRTSSQFVGRARGKTPTGGGVEQGGFAATAVNQFDPCGFSSHIREEP